MKTKWLNVGNFEELIQKYNPFGFKNPDGEVCAYETRYLNYVEAIKRMKASSTGGYLDVQLFVHDNTGMPIAYCQRLVDEHYKNGITEEVWITWEQSSVCHMAVRRILEMLHSISGTTLDEKAYYEAIKTI
ncbi:MAG: hypothetical protein LIR46_11495 [Bacteroidota bacterium]|nr:hypothetical protein [Bacteroidota bacterium]